jgi:hypothetical protein
LVITAANVTKTRTSSQWITTLCLRVSSPAIFVDMLKMLRAAAHVSSIAGPGLCEPETRSHAQVVAQVVALIARAWR